MFVNVCLAFFKSSLQLQNKIITYVGLRLFGFQTERL